MDIKNTISIPEVSLLASGVSTPQVSDGNQYNFIYSTFKMNNEDLFIRSIDWRADCKIYRSDMNDEQGLFSEHAEVNENLCLNRLIENISELFNGRNEDGEINRISTRIITLGEEPQKFFQ